MTPMEEIAPFCDVPVTVEAEIGRPPMKLGEVLALRQGQVISLERSAGENIDVRVGGVLVGFGEVIVSENGVGVRLTDFREEQ
jgi:flagellar motor switch protein FliN/FliY